MDHVVIKRMIYIYIYIHLPYCTCMYVGWRVSDLTLQNIEHILVDCHNCGTDSAFDLFYGFTEEKLEYLHAAL